MAKAKIFMASMVGVLALSGFASTLAWAVPPGWMVNGVDLTSGTKALATTAAVDRSGEYETGGIVVKCTGNSLKGVNPVINGSTNMVNVSSAEVTGCEVTTGNPPCKLATSMENTIKTLPLLVDLTLDGPLAIKARVLSTNSSKLLATILFEGSECEIAHALQPITGALTFLVSEEQDERASQLLTLTNEEPGSLKDGKNEIELSGSFLPRLASGEPYSFL